MLEKIGLPPKPSLRGNNWVVDASHCQGCCSQFTMFNRKHHCRRCGGLFCNTCTQQRMYLRGQGDSPVRICDPCKKLEEAARLEARHGYKSRAAKGSSRPATKLENELDLILGTDGEQSLQSVQGSVEDIVSDVLAAGTSQKFETTQGREFDIPGSSSINLFTSGADEMGSSSPEDLHKRAQEEKRKYSILKREGKSDEALRAFKRGKDLERQAASLELALRKKRGNPSSTLTSLSSDRANNQPSSSGRKKTDKQGKETDDLTSELKELGWSEADLHDADKKPEKMTLEGELISILKEVPKKSSLKKENNDADKAQIVSLKRNALKLKREGKLAEAKEELRKAKTLEKELEEKEFLGDDEDESDDEIAALIRGIDNGNHDDTEIDFASNVNLDLSYITDVSGGIGIDGDFDVTDDDMNDPEIVAALRSFGWEEPAVASSSVNLEALRNDVLSLKREAVRLKRQGNNVAAMEQLKQAKRLEVNLQQFESEDTNNQRTTTTLRSSADTHEFSAYTEGAKTTRNLVSTRPSKSKSEIQKELLGLKRNALARRREGRVDEAEEELKKCKALEIQLDELENAKKMTPAVGKGSGFDDELHGVSGSSVLPEEGLEEVSEQDMHDPSLLSVLHTLGWKDEDEHFVTGSLESSSRVNHAVVPDNGTSELEVKVRRSRTEIQKELLAIKRKSLALRRQGKLEEAEDELKKAKVLEDQMKEIDSSRVDLTVDVEDTEVGHLKETDFGSLNVTKQQKHAGKVGEESSFPALSSLSSKNVESGDGTASAVSTKAQRGRAEIQKELLGIKRRSLALRRQGKLEEAEEELKKAKILEVQIEEIDSLKQSPVLDSNAGFGDELRHLVFGSSDLTKQKDDAGLPAEETSKSVNRRDALEVIEAIKGTDFKENNLAGHPGRKLETTVLVTSQNEQKMSKPFIGLHGSFDLLQEENLPALDLHQAAEPSYIPDLLTGEGWVGSDSTYRKADGGEALSSSTVEGGSSSAQLLQSFEPNLTNRKTDIKAEFLSGANFVGWVREHENTSGSFQTVPEVDSDARSTSVKNIADQILTHKRRAVALKREGKLAEAKEELRHAKILEQGLGSGGDNRGSSPASDPGRNQQTLSLSSMQNVTLPHNSASGITSISPESKHQGQAHKPVSGRDRFKLQQECLSHKRQALRLRREGQMEESEREFELAKALESQLEESPQGQTPAVGSETTDDVSIEDLLDPQLFSALQAIGMQGLELPTAAPQVRAAKGDIPKLPASSNVGSSKNPSQERSQLEEKIKAEKVQALHLKRAGKQPEAMEALRRAKLLEKKLNFLSS